MYKIGPGVLKSLTCKTVLGNFDSISKSLLKTPKKLISFDLFLRINFNQFRQHLSKIFSSVFKKCEYFSKFKILCIFWILLKILINTLEILKISQTLPGQVLRNFFQGIISKTFDSVSEVKHWHFPKNCCTYIFTSKVTFYLGSPSIFKTFPPTPPYPSIRLLDSIWPDVQQTLIDEATSDVFIRQTFVCLQKRRKSRRCCNSKLLLLVPIF